ncbi:hypothetical protein [Desulfolutivibrio sulfoxidireducens]|uniref:hypothetical protein n=1 Tax=Desulfolutivibrio sulfoxidireducens TaxID=2773299 RepID=UPI00159D8F90|nr:hypothetical protein [Desulfolutivibrio sulfoxidireducens]QLA15319.1 hypothetical protein GD605_03775 [Desulfolutivibrio sulfoxidireducens]QLA18895.1 hypothetical protein GD604_03685 [Desulfolutivibrio sulfoxidireducens]
MPQKRPFPASAAHPGPGVPHAPLARCARLPPLGLIAALLLCLAASPAHSGVIFVGQTQYRLENGRTFLGPWDVVEETIMAKEVAIVVMEERSDQRMVQTLLQTLESMNVPTLFTKIRDYKILKERGVIVPHPKAAPKDAP